MNRSFLGRFALALALIAGVAGSALSSDAGNHSGTDFDKIIDRIDISALIFEPAQPDAMGAVLRDIHLTSQVDDADGNGQYVLDAAGRADVLSLLQKYGKVKRQLHQQVIPSEDGRASAIAMWPGEYFSASLKTRYISSVNHLPSAFILDYSLKASLERPEQGGAVPDESASLRYASGGSVLLADKGALMSIRETGSKFLIWIVSVN